MIRTVKKTGRRSILTIPLIGPRLDAFNDVVEDAVKENIVVVTAAGKKLLNS